MRIGRKLRQALQHRLHHPAVDPAHQPVALGGGDETGRRQRPPVFRQHPQQHLVPGPAGIVDRGDRHQEQLEPVVLQRVLHHLEIADFLEARPHLVVVWVEHRQARAALFLGDQAGPVRPVQHVLHRRRGGGEGLPVEQRDADAGADGKQLAVPGKADRLDRVDHPLAQRYGYRLVGDIDDQREFVAAQSRDEGIRVEAPQQARHLAQQGIARGVAGQVVDHLEVVEIDQQQRRAAACIAAALAGAQLDATAEFAFQRVAVGQFRQRVEQRLAAHAAVELRRLGDVAHVDDGADQRVVLALQRLQADGIMRVLAVGARPDEVVLHHLAGKAAGQVRQHALLEPVHADDVGHRHAHDFLGQAVPDHRIGGIGPQEAEAAVDHGQRVGGLADDLVLHRHALFQLVQVGAVFHGQQHADHVAGLVAHRLVADAQQLAPGRAAQAPFHGDLRFARQRRLDLRHPALVDGLAHDIGQVAADEAGPVELFGLQQGGVDVAHDEVAVEEQDADGGSIERRAVGMQVQLRRRRRQGAGISHRVAHPRSPQPAPASFDIAGPPQKNPEG